jgi:hypothetical protein
MHSLEAIKWRDHTGGDSANWKGFEKLARESRLQEIESVGWVVYEDKNVLTIVPHVCWIDNTGCGEMTILKSAIVKRRKL